MVSNGERSVFPFHMVPLFRAVGIFLPTVMQTFREIRCFAAVCLDVRSSVWVLLLLSVAAVPSGWRLLGILFSFCAALSFYFVTVCTGLEWAGVLHL